MVSKTIVPNEPVQLRSFADLDAFAKRCAPPLMSDEPCPCGEPKQYGHRYCVACKAQKRKATWKESQRKVRAG